MDTRRQHPSVPGALALALACLLAGPAPRPAGAQCSYTPLTAYESETVDNSPAFYTVDQAYAGWMAVAIKPPSTADWDISVWSGTDIYPTCVSGQLAGSALGYGVDFVVGDFNHNAPGVQYVEVNRYSGTGDGTLEWDATGGLMAINAPLETLPFGGPIFVHDVYLEAGRTYAFTLSPTHVADFHMLLFRNATGGTCWKRRVDAEWDVTASTTYTAPGTGFYGLVVVKDDWALGDARVRVAACTPPYALTSGEIVGTGLAENYFSIDQQQGFWTAVGVRGARNWTVGAYRENPGSLTGDCFADPLAASTAGLTTAGVVVGDFGYNAAGTYYVGVRCPLDYYIAPGYVQWDDGADELTVNGMITHGTMTSLDIVRAWDVYLEAGTAYHVTFERSGADLRLLLFRDPGAAEYWAARGGQVLTTTTSTDYTAPATGYYGAVVVNDNGVAGDYAVGFGACAPPVLLDSGVPHATALGENYVVFDQAAVYWTAIGVRGSDPGTDWDMVVQAGTAEPFPDCRGPDLGVSDQYPPTVDFVVGDFNHNTTGTYYGWPHTWYGEGGGTGTVLWDQTHGPLAMNGSPVYVATGPDEFLQAWDVLLTAGLEYRFHAGATVPGTRLLLFRNPAAGTHWAPRSSAVLDVAVPGGASVDPPYVAPASDWYGVVLVNDGGAPGTGNLRVTDPSATDAEDRPPVSTALTGVRPNPAHGGVSVAFGLAAAATVSFRVLDLSGRQVALLPARVYGAGERATTWDGRGDGGARLPAGLYFVRMTVGGDVVGTARVTLLE